MRPICQINLIYTKTPSHVQLHQTHRVRDIPTTVCRRRCLSLPRSQQTHCRNKSHTIPLCSIRARNPHWTGGESSKTACVFFPPPQFFNDNDTFSPPRITEGRADGDPGLSYPPSPSDFAPTCDSQKVPASPEKMPSMTPSQRLPRLTSPLAVYGDTIHQNDGTHLDGGIGVAEDAKWQRLHLRVAACNLPLYDLPNGRWANWFLETLTNLWVGVVERRWNSERPLVFQACILWRVRGISRFHNGKPIIWG